MGEFVIPHLGSLETRGLSAKKGVSLAMLFGWEGEVRREALQKWVMRRGWSLTLG